MVKSIENEIAEFYFKEKGITPACFSAELKDGKMIVRYKVEDKPSSPLIKERITLGDIVKIVAKYF
jgi:hypothetical protein